MSERPLPTNDRTAQLTMVYHQQYLFLQFLPKAPPGSSLSPLLITAPPYYYYVDFTVISQYLSTTYNIKMEQSTYH